MDSVVDSVEAPVTEDVNSVDVEGIDAANETPEEKIAQLYIATFDRAPDDEGLAYWVEQYNNGISLDDIAKSFFDQKETEQMHGDLDNDEFVERIYEKEEWWEL